MGQMASFLSTSAEQWLASVCTAKTHVPHRGNPDSPRGSSSCTVESAVLAMPA